MFSLNEGWEFTETWSKAFMKGEGTAESVSLPHTVREVPQHYAGPEMYEMICGYRRKLFIPADAAGKRVFLQFDGAAHIAELFVNGTRVCGHRCGYTAFRADITEFVNPGEECLVSLRLDCTENPEVPPFGYVIDYLTYGGLYREAWLDIRPMNFIEDIYITTPDLHTAAIRTSVSGSGEVQVKIFDAERLIASGSGLELSLSVPEAEPWNLSTPKMYTCEVTVGEDVQRVDFGFRSAEFRADGFYLNGEKTFLRGLNRHQSFPYIGYAAPERLQREDARILKHELGCTAVRTSHYPQSRHFIDECDRIGLLVFTEIPGWQHLGGEQWQEQAFENTREMVMQYRNHPSIVLWGVRINESLDCDELYKRTNALAHELDPSRATSGVRYLEKSSLLEDVYSYNDFSHTGDNAGARPKKAVTPDTSKALIISEHNGHMFPTKAFDTWQRRQSHALRHARVLNDALADGDHAGCFGWCMFDYPTHKDFGSGDRVCYHGVMDAFRNPKLAAALYASQSDEVPVIESGCPMDIGDYPAGITGDIYVFTNADSVRLYKNDTFTAEFTSKDYPALPHGPVKIDDLVGEMLESIEGFSPEKSAAVKKAFSMIRTYGANSLPVRCRAYVGWVMLRYGLSYDKAYDLYGKYVANWGGEATRWRFEAIKDGKVAASKTCCPAKRLHLEAKPCCSVLTEKNSYDMASVRVRICDDNGSTAPYAQYPVSFSLSGPAELTGPSTVTAEGGMTGTFIKTVGRTGRVSLTVSCTGLEPVRLEFEVE